MKKLILAALSVFIIASLAKANTSSNKSNFDLRVPVKNWIKKNKKNFRVSLGNGNLTTNLRARLSKTEGIDSSDNESNSNNLQLNLGYEKAIDKNFGYSTFLTYQNSEIEVFGGNEELRNYRVSGNVTYRLTKQASIYGGLNYGAWFGSGEIEDNLDAGIGYQAGISLDIFKNAVVEFEYLTLLNEGRINNLDIGNGVSNAANLDLESKGVMLKVKLPIVLNI